MLKGLFFCVPSVSVDKTLTPVIDEIGLTDYEIVYYNTANFEPAGPHPFRFIAYPDGFRGYYSDRVDETTSYFQFGEILIDTAADLMDFLIGETQREKPDFIIHSHLAVWGKLLAKKYRLPAITLYTTFVLDKRIMLPFLRKTNSGADAGLANVHAGIGFYRKCASLYHRLQLEDKPDAWDAYVNAGDLNLSFIHEAFQPRKEILGEGYAFPGYPFPFEARRKTGSDLIYVAMGTIVNKDLEFYRTCIDVLSRTGYRAILSVGSKVDLAQLGPLPGSIRAAAFVDQRAILRETALFITRGGMASVHEAIHTMTPMIVIPVIPEQQVTAGRIEELGIGIVIPSGQVTRERLSLAIGQILSNYNYYAENIKALHPDGPALSAPAKARALLREFFSSVSPAGKTLVDGFLSRVQKMPEAIALRCGERQLSYGELHEQSHRLAQCLRQLGIGRGVAAAIVLEPCPEMLVAILGILMAGGCFIPIDAEYPAERIGYILRDSACAAVLSKRALVQRCGLQKTPALLLLDEPLPGPAAAPGPAAVYGPSAFEPAYIIYTSGSTGRPKGVIVEHRQIYAYMTAVYHQLQLEECASYAILGTFAADAGLTAVFAALCFRGCLHIIDIKSFTSFGSLTGYFRKFPVDCYKITPSLLSRLMANNGARELLPAKRLLVGGEACPRVLAEAIYKLLPPGCRLFNHYGPTETTVGVTTYAFPARAEELPAAIPIGTPLPGVEAYILDATGATVPPGEMGELYIGGAFVARGYLNKPELTDEKFTTVLLSGRHKRLYTTGDLVRSLPDGNLEYLGRMDDQVKILGNRIELREVEETIHSSGLIRRCVVLPKTSPGRSPYLVAYIQGRESSDKDELIRFLRARLPSYMIPGVWIDIEEWPLTANNKIDRKALPDPGMPEPGMRHPRMPEPPATGVHYTPGGETEAVLTDIWMKLLGISAIGPTDEFFQLGGNSLQLLQLSFEIHDRLCVAISAAELFEYTTIERLTARLAGMGRQDGTATVAGATPVAGTTEFDATEATPAQRNFFIQNRLYPREAFPNSSLTYAVGGDLDMATLEKAMMAIISANESLHTSYHLNRGKLELREETPVFRVETISCLANDIDKEILAAIRPFNPGQAPLIRVLLLRLPDNRLYLHLYLPHINSDGESLKLIMQDLETLYNGGKPAERRPFAFFRQHLHAYLHSGQYAEDEAFWSRQFEEDIPLLPFDFGLPAKDNGQKKFDGAFEVVPFPESLTAALQRYQKEKNATVFQLLFIAWFLLLNKLTACDDLTVLLPVHGRDTQGFESIMGLLSNVIPVRLRIDAGRPAADCIQAGKKVILTAIRHQQYPFEHLLALWAKKGRRSKNLRQTFFGYHDHRREYSLGDGHLQLYIPERDKEDLPLSAAVFETRHGTTIRISSTAGGFSSWELRSITELYFALIRQLTESTVCTTSITI